MNRGEFQNIMLDPVHADRRSVSEMFELIEMFPYFQSAHLLLLKNLQVNGDVKFEKQLKASAIHVADREVLYFLLTDPAPANEETKEIISVQGNVESALSIDAEEEDKLQTVIESVNNSEDLIEEIERTADEEENSGEEEENADLIIISALEDEPEMDETDRELHSYSGMDLLELDSESDISPEMEKPDNAEEIMSRAELIDKFIAANPRIEPVRDRTDAPIEDRSLQFLDSGGFVSETLARIYITQGYYSRAIDIFEKLSLKYPEKSSYFATQIEKVKEYLK